MGEKCRECKNFIPIDGTIYGRCKVKKYIKTRRGRDTNKEFLVERSRNACKTNFVLVESVPPIIKYCQNCGEPFEVKERSRQKFCSRKCCNSWNYEKSKTGTTEVRACEMCGKPIEGKQRKYCVECAGSHRKAMAVAPKKVHKRKVMSISEINTLALKEHLSYGEYVVKYGV